jgi:hypothetical protein
MKAADRHKTILVIVAGLLVLFWIFDNKYLLWAASGISLVTLVIPVTGEWLVWAWFKLAQVLGWINSRILLSAIFFLILTPIAIISRLFQKDNLQLKGKDASTLFHSRDHLYTKDDLSNPW